MSFNKLPLAKKVGEVSEDDDKFLSWSGSHGYYTRPSTVSNPFQTDKMLNGTYNRDEMIHNATLCTTQREINKSQVEFKKKTVNDPKMLGKSASRNFFVNQRQLNHIMQDRGTVENFQVSFDKVHEETYLVNTDRGELHSIQIKHVPDVVNDCLGVDSPEFIMDRFVELSNKYSAGGNKKLIE